MDEFQREAVIIALRHMFEKGWLDICAIDQCLKIAGSIPRAKDYEALRVLHCVDWGEMNPDFRREVYSRILNLFKNEGFDLSVLDMIFNEKSNVFELKREKKRSWLLGR